MKPDITVGPADRFRRCYGCNGEAHGTLVFGHRSEDGRIDNAHALSMCITCMKDVARVTAEATETA